MSFSLYYVTYALFLQKKTFLKDYLYLDYNLWFYNNNNSLLFLDDYIWFLSFG